MDYFTVSTTNIEDNRYVDSYSGPCEANKAIAWGVFNEIIIDIVNKHMHALEHIDIGVTFNSMHAVKICITKDNLLTYGSITEGIKLVLNNIEQRQCNNPYYKGIPYAQVSKMCVYYTK